eukprot:4694926-Pleurochrysis_carterae.AAC.1
MLQAGLYPPCHGSYFYQPPVSPAFAQHLEAVRARIELEELEELYHPQMSRARVRFEVSCIMKQ